MFAGLTEIVCPAPSAVPPQTPEYQYQLAAVPREPPTAVSVTELPEQIVVKDALIKNALADVSLTIIVLLKHMVLLHNPSPRK